MKVVFHVSRPVSNGAAVTNLEQPAKLWLGELLAAAAEQGLAGSDPAVAISFPEQGVRVAFEVTEFPIAPFTAINN